MWRVAFHGGKQNNLDSAVETDMFSHSPEEYAEKEEHHAEDEEPGKAHYLEQNDGATGMSPPVVSSKYSSMSVIILPDPVVPVAIEKVDLEDYIQCANLEKTPTPPPPAAKRLHRTALARKQYTPTDDVDDSFASEEAPSDFSRLANKYRSCSNTTRPIGQMSLAKLTSGVSDGAWNSR